MKPEPSRAEDRAVLEQAVRDAGDIALRFFRRCPASRKKADGTPVSEADLAVDKALRERLLAARPDYGWLSEETADDKSRLDRTRVWIVDPIDGTRAFLEDRPDWTIAAALVENGRPVLGIVFNPAREEFFAATRDQGTTLNGAAVHASDRRLLEGASLIASAGLPRRKDWTSVWPPVKTTWVNSVAYRLALVAGGGYDATISLSKKSDWDLAAADLLVQEAGAKLTTHRGEPLLYNGVVPVHESIVAANPALHAALIARTAALKLH
jgi:myo-inositol-1(or 4)-monophosphatase